MCDPVEMYGTNKFARINIQGQDYYVARPDTILGYKILHMLQSFDQKPEKFNTDFDQLHQALTALYSEEELIQLTHHILQEYEERIHEPHLPNMVKNLMERPNLDRKVREYINKVKKFQEKSSR